MSVTTDERDTCAFCEPVEHRLCGSNAGGFTCTRAPGHDGEHVACGGDGWHAMYRWGGQS